MAEKTITVRVLLCPEAHADGVLWVAQCLEYDIAAQGRSISAAHQAILQALNDQAKRDAAEGREPFVDFDQAPAEFWKHFDSGLPLEEKPTPEALPPAWMIRAQETRVC
jgi:hypothetical protein